MYRLGAPFVAIYPILLRWHRLEKNKLHNLKVYKFCNCRIWTKIMWAESVLLLHCINNKLLLFWHDQNCVLFFMPPRQVSVVGSIPYTVKRVLLSSPPLLQIWGKGRVGWKQGIRKCAWHLLLIFKAAFRWQPDASWSPPLTQCVPG